MLPRCLYKTKTFPIPFFSVYFRGLELGKFSGYVGKILHVLIKYTTATAEKTPLSSRSGQRHWLIFYGMTLIIKIWMYTLCARVHSDSGGCFFFAHLEHPHFVFRSQGHPIWHELSVSHYICSSLSGLKRPSIQLTIISVLRLIEAQRATIRPRLELNDR